MLIGLGNNVLLVGMVEVIDGLNVLLYAMDDTDDIGLKDWFIDDAMDIGELNDPELFGIELEIMLLN